MTAMSAKAIRKKLKGYSSKKKAVILSRFFKTGRGEYAEGDIFIGVMVPQTREVVKEYKDMDLAEAMKLLRSRIHEERLAALLILVSKFKRACAEDKANIYDLYLKNSDFINNWDLVDSSAHHIVGGFLKDRSKDKLYDLASSKNLWERRISIIATFNFIRDGRFDEALKIADRLMNDKEDLIHKAVGWMLREVGKRNTRVLESFLDKRRKKMPRTMLRYAIEKFPESKRRRYLNK